MNEIQQYIKKYRGRTSFRLLSEILEDDKVKISPRVLAHWEAGTNYPNVRVLTIQAQQATGSGATFCYKLLELLGEIENE